MAFEETWDDDRSPPQYNDHILHSPADDGFTEHHQHRMVRNRSYCRALSEDRPAAAAAPLDDEPPHSPIVQQQQRPRSYSTSRIERSTHVYKLEAATMGDDAGREESWKSRLRSKFEEAKKAAFNALLAHQHHDEDLERAENNRNTNLEIEDEMIARVREAERRGSLMSQIRFREDDRTTISPSHHRRRDDSEQDFIVNMPTPKIEEISSRRMSTTSVAASRRGSNAFGRAPHEMIVAMRPQPTTLAEVEAENILNAMQCVDGGGSPSPLQLLCELSNEQRQNAWRAYASLYDRDLTKDLINRLYSDCETLIIALMLAPDEYDASRLHKAVIGKVAPADSIVNEIMCMRTNRELEAIKIAYKRLFSKDLESDLTKLTSHFYRRIVLTLCAARRSEDKNVNERDGLQDAQILLEILRHPPSSKYADQDETELIRILCTQHSFQLRRVFYHYSLLCQISLNDLSNKFKADAEQCLITIVKAMKNRPKYYAELILQALSGPGRTDEMLVRVIVGRAEIDLAEIRREFERMYDKSLARIIEENTTGPTREVLLILLKRSERIIALEPTRSPMPLEASQPRSQPWQAIENVV